MNAFHEGDIYPVDVGAPQKNPKSLVFTMYLLSNADFHTSDFYIYESQYDPVSLQYMLEFFRQVGQSMPSQTTSPTTDPDAVTVEPVPGSARDMLQDRAGIIVLREDLDYYAIPPRPDIQQAEMIEVKRAAGKALLRQNGIFSGLRKSEETGSTEQHLIEMLTAGYDKYTPPEKAWTNSEQRLPPRRPLGSSSRGTQQSRHLQHCACASPN